MSYSEKVVLKSVKSQLVAANLGITLDASSVEISTPIIQNLFNEARSYVFSFGVEVGNGMVLYHDMELRNFRSVIIEVIIVIKEKIPENGKIWVYELPGVENMATAVHRGSLATLGETYELIQEWIEKNNYQIIGPVREVYLEFDQNVQPSATEVQFPVRKVEV